MFPKVVSPQCSACEARAGREEAEAASVEEAGIEDGRRKARLSLIPPELRRTSIAHRGFNAGLWTRIEGWNPATLRWLGLIGPPGTCKTRCLALLSKRLILAGYHVAWTTAVELQNRIEETRLSDRGEAAAARGYLRLLKSAGLLVLDDIGKNSWSDGFERHLFDVVDHRKTNDLPVMWTANQSPAEILRSGVLSPQRGGPLMGRLVEVSTIEKS